MKKIILIYFVLICNVSIAEVIDGPANCRLKPHGEVLLSLNDGIYVCVLEREGDWFKIIVNLKIPKEELGSSFIQLREVVSFNGEIIGKAVSNIPSDSYEYLQDGSNYLITCVLYTHKTNIKRDSIVELPIVSKINNGELSLDFFKGLINHFPNNYTDLVGFRCLIGFDIFSPVAIPSFRIGIVYNRNTLNAIVLLKDKMSNVNLNSESYLSETIKETAFGNILVIYMSKEILAKRDIFEQELFEYLSQG